jgi:hypothetical protein
MLRRCSWDHKSLPYVPPPTGADQTPAMVCWFKLDEPVMRVCVCNAQGEYHSLKPGMPYVEYVASVVTVGEIPPPDATRDASTQVAWGDLPLPPMSEGFKKYFPAMPVGK